ncbi:ParA family protein [Paraburkholderia caribensis]|uniref:ParA family protein n=1 Tax=Paraburkholderia caribensis TaxID=75105 RepID=UPI0034D2F6FC
MSTKPFKVQAAAQLLRTTIDMVRRLVDESGIKVERQQEGTKTRLFSIENIFELAMYKANRRANATTERKQVVASVYSPRDGVGKTTLASNLAAGFALKGLRTLVVDLDFQAGLTRSFGYDPELTREEALGQEISQSRIVEYHFGNLLPDYPFRHVSLLEAVKKPYGDCGPHLIPADLTLDRLETILAEQTREDPNAHFAFARLIKDGMSTDPTVGVSGYDVILFDAAAARNRSTSCALLASDYVISPVSIAKSSTKALSYLSEVLTETKDRFHRTPDLILVGNFFDPNPVHVMGQLSTITQAHRDAWLERSIRRSDEFSEGLAGLEAHPIIVSKPSGQASAELRDCVDALLKRMCVTVG